MYQRRTDLHFHPFDSIFSQHIPKHVPGTAPFVAFSDGVVFWQLRSFLVTVMLNHFGRSELLGDSGSSMTLNVVFGECVCVCVISAYKAWIYWTKITNNK